MENIIRKRHPNSLPALIWAAASLPDDPATKPQSVAFLESRILKLETELASKDEEAKKSMRALEQKYNSVKVWLSVCVLYAKVKSFVSHTGP